MLINTEKMIPVTQLQRDLTQKLREVSETNEPLYILRNNKLAVVILSAEEYEMLRQAEDILEHLEIAEMVKKRIEGYDPVKNISWQKLKDKHGL